MIENPLLQQRELLAGRALAKLDRKVVEVTGDDRASWLHNMLSQNILGLKAGESSEALLLDVQGHVLADLHLLVQEERILLVLTEPEVAPLLDWFQKAKFRSKVAWQITNFEVLGSWAKPVSETYWKDNWPNVAQGGFRYGEAKGEEWFWFENLVEQVPAGFELVPETAVDALRIAAHRPSAAELDEKTLPHELNLLTTAVHLSKGCYRGQETVAKVHNLGHPPRRLVMLHLDGSGHLLPEVGAEVEYQGQVKGRVTSVAQHYEMGPIALAVVSRNVPENAELSVSGISATQEIVVPASAGATVEKRTVARKSLL